MNTYQARQVTALNITMYLIKVIVISHNPANTTLQGWNDRKSNLGVINITQLGIIWIC